MVRFLKRCVAKATAVRDVAWEEVRGRRLSTLSVVLLLLTIFFAETPSLHVLGGVLFAISAPSAQLVLAACGLARNARAGYYSDGGVSRPGLPRPGLSIDSNHSSHLLLKLCASCMAGPIACVQ